MRTMFHLGLTQIVQISFPMAELLQVFGDMLRKQDVLRIATIHHSLGNVDAGTGDIGATAYVDDATDRATMYAHAQLKFGMLLHRSAHLQCTFHRRFWCVV